jgi:hypothetical protein
MKFLQFKLSIITLLIALCFTTEANAQKDSIKNYRALFKFMTIKQPDNSRMLEASFVMRHRKDRKNILPVYEGEIKFYNTSEDEDILLGSALTDKKGIAQLVLPDSQQYITDAEGYINLKAEFEANGPMKSTRKSLAVKDVFFEMDLVEIDSVRTVQFNAYTLDSLNTQVPVEYMDVVFSVGGMLNNLPVEEASVEDGYYEFEFPTDIPGDPQGNLDIFVTLEDHDDFGYVIQQKNVNWGVFHETVKESRNTLWSQAAPIWMYVVLTIMLVGVWANYVYSFINLFRISKEGKEIAKSQIEKEA